MNTKIYCLSLFTLLASLTYGQSNPVRILNNISLPKDTAIKEALLRSLDGFLRSKDSANAANGFVSKADLLETSLLTDEMKGIEKNARYNNSTFFKPYLTNVIQRDEHTYLLQLSYMGTREDTAILRGSFRLLARQEADRFIFLSPLSTNVMLWKTHRIDNVVFRYKEKINLEDAKKLQQMILYYDKKIGAPQQQIRFYCCDDFEEALKLIGVEYKAIYNGYNHLSLYTCHNNQTLIVSGMANPTGFNEFDPHDLWHDRLHNMYSTGIINKPVDEGCAYLYGGSWGIEWKEILAASRGYAAKNEHSDWLALYISEQNFVEGTKRLNIAYVINALIVQQLEKEKGFDAVKALLCCGKREKGDENYFRMLEKVAGISKAVFNSRVDRLIAER
ncbi:hypothetical protein [Chitinophaga sp. GbtcB8]|uniref:hypothetical protein n=1 Tax=Chitinophaga sp. GbtcB8 TaxID=2824753 RepID=UPI001C3057AE|nr:hypothetical protein [Chitinophaga sp. GbtcB8]